MIKLKPELIANLGTIDGLRDTLQNAIMLEHSTIPTYLYALYSIKPGSNQAISNLIHSIVIEEMLHMGIACNILNAIGGSPVINQPGFIPSYPGPLPGGVETGLIVPLAGLSLDLVYNVFMEIEEPEDPLNFPQGGAAPEEEPITIGQFYAAIKAQIEQFGDSIFTGNPNNQVPLSQNWPDANVPTINSAASAMAAIDLIVEQGEGTSTSPLDLEGDLAHYYRYAEIYYGKTLVPIPDPPYYSYSGAPITLDPDGVQPVVQNPKEADYPVDSPARNQCHTFNSTYTDLLNSLNLTFNGSPGTLNTAIGIMVTLEQQATSLMAVPLGNGQNAGPSFEYHPDNI